jgi:hypothetical protein
MTCLYCVGSMEPRMDSNAETSSASLKPSLLPSLVPRSRSPSWSGRDFPAPAEALSNSYRRTRASEHGAAPAPAGAKHLLRANAFRAFAAFAAFAALLKSTIVAPNWFRDKGSDHAPSLN